MNAFEVLGIAPDATQEQVHQAYRARVKQHHPDQFEDREMQLRAQEKLVELNLAYEQAMKAAANRQTSFSALPAEQAIAVARKLMDQGHIESALGQMTRAQSKTEEWYFFQGQLLMKLKQFSSAHQAFRAAILLSPDNREYRAWALDAAVAMKKHQKLHYRVADWAQSLFSRK
ncbi:MAG: DnaJ domain-containing protein [Clostridia bacterium]|nr:DnaJ domain-containing protein [Clostridia bacterium]